MKKLVQYASLFLVGTVIALSSCKKTEDPTPDANPDAKVFINEMTSTNNGGNVTIGSVTTTDGTVKLRLEVTGTNNLDNIYIMLSQDNAAFQPLSVATIVNSYGTFTGGSSNYTLQIPNIKSFIVDIPVSVRTSSAAVNDVYQIWITNGTGSFTKPTKNRDLGIATINLKYTAAAPDATFTTFSSTVGDQQAVEPSYIVTSGQGNVMTQVDYRDNTDGLNAKSVDISFASLDNAGTGLGANPYLISPSIRTSVGFNPANEPIAANTNETHFIAWSGTAFASATASDLATISASATKVAISSNNTYAFVTQAGKKGLIQVGSITTSGTSGQKFTFTIKVLN